MSKQEQNEEHEQGTSAAADVMCAPWTDYNGDDIFVGDRIGHPSGQCGTVVYYAFEDDAYSRWRIKYDDGTVSRLCLQVGYKGQATVHT